MVLLPYDDISMELVLRTPTWDSTRDALVGGGFGQLQTVRVVTVPDPDAYPKKLDEAPGYEALSPCWRTAVRERFGKELADKLVLH